MPGEVRYFGNPWRWPMAERLKVPAHGLERGAPDGATRCTARHCRESPAFISSTRLLWWTRCGELLAGSVDYGVDADAALARATCSPCSFTPEKSHTAGLQAVAQFSGVERQMLIIPAIDLEDGQCVRLRQGLMEDSTVFSDDPAAMARRWVAGWLPPPAPGGP